MPRDLGDFLLFRGSSVLLLFHEEEYLRRVQRAFFMKSRYALNSPWVNTTEFNCFHGPAYDAYTSNLDIFVLGERGQKSENNINIYSE